jgi:hypothetical protein
MFPSEVADRAADPPGDTVPNVSGTRAPTSTRGAMATDPPKISD